MASWADLEQTKPEPKVDEFSSLCARLFTTVDGREFIKMVRAMIVETPVPVTASDSFLRSMEGQRQFVRRIEGAIERGLQKL